MIRLCRACIGQNIWADEVKCVSCTDGGLETSLSL